jgi:hypothetical protein
MLGLYQYVTLWARLQTLTLDVAAADKFLWKWTVDKQYTASSAYRAFLVGPASILGAIELHKTRALPTSKFFVWLAFLGRGTVLDVRTLQRHQLPNNGVCAF